MTHMIWVKRGCFLFNQSIKYASINHPSHQPSKHSFIKSSINQQQLNALDTYKRQFIHSCMHSFIYLVIHSVNQSINQSIKTSIMIRRTGVRWFLVLLNKATIRTLRCYPYNSVLTLCGGARCQLQDDLPVESRSCSAPSCKKNQTINEFPSKNTTNRLV